MTSIEPLDPLRQQAWHTFVSLSTRLSAAIDTHLARECKLTHFEFRVLSTLAARDKHRLQLSALASAVDASLSRLSHVVTTLERRQLVRRTAGNRHRNAILTSHGHQAVLVAMPVYIDAVRALALDALTDTQIEQWLTLTRAVLSHNSYATAAREQQPTT
ncbi:MarR family winged helix-turn-helix transcriptional regulator [Nocardia asiatica]|uniref:MarR family winged helix-turn-helix transcriptional regulator n=1 Tax=Nocardia asiatica TaxID=209252 RepID=UPI00245764B5|nr:MarR family winged helix-turn-helix transcriptional regulator [Nocardia asiatica]